MGLRDNSTDVATVLFTVGGKRFPNRDAPTLLGIVLSLSDIELEIGNTEQISAIAQYSDGSLLDVTSTGTWQVDDPTAATVSDRGLVTGIAIGTTTLRFSYSIGTATAGINVFPPVIDSGDEAWFFLVPA